MIVDIIDDGVGLRALEPAWRKLYGEDRDAQVFLSVDWLGAMLADSGARFKFVTVRNSPCGALLGLLPLSPRPMLRRSGGFAVRLVPAGGKQADCNGFLCRPGLESTVLPRFAEALRRLRWKRIDFYNLLASYPRTAKLFDAIAPRDATITQREVAPDPFGIDNTIAPYAKLPATWEEFLASQLSANSRQKARRLLRKLDSGEDLHVTHATIDSLERDVDILIRLWTANWGHVKGDTLGQIQTIIRESVTAYVRNGLADLLVLWQDDHPLAAHVLYQDREKRRVHFAIGGRDKSSSGLQPGYLLHCYAIRKAIGEGYRIYDFLKGNEAYKYSFCSDGKQMRYYVIERTSQSRWGRIDQSMADEALRLTLPLHQSGKLAEARRCYEEILDATPGHPEALSRLGQLEAHVGNHDRAAALFRARLAKMPDCAWTRDRLGDALTAVGDAGAAVAAYASAADRDPSTADPSTVTALARPEPALRASCR